MEEDAEAVKLRQLLADPGADREHKVGRLADEEFFAQSPGRLGLLVELILDHKNADMDIYMAAFRSLVSLIEAGVRVRKEDAEKIRSAAEGEEPIARQRAGGILRAMKRRMDIEHTQNLWKLLHSPGTPMEEKEKLLHCSENFSRRRENADVLVEFLLGNMCDGNLFSIGKRAYDEVNQEGKGAHITQAQLRLIGAALKGNCKEVADRAEELYAVAAKYAPRAVLEHPEIPVWKKKCLLEDKGLFVSDMPRSVSILVDFMLDSSLCVANEKAWKNMRDGDPRRVISPAAMGTFESLVRGGLELDEAHKARIVGMMVADPSLDSLQREQRENAFWMFSLLVRNGVEIPRKLRGRIASAAVEVWPRDNNEPRKEEWRLKKLYGLMGMELILAAWLVQLKEGKASGWPFRPEDKALISFDTTHEDRELRDAARRVDVLVSEIDEEIRAVEIAERSTRIRKRKIRDDVLAAYMRGEPIPDSAEEVLSAAAIEADEELAKGGAAGNGTAAKECVRAGVRGERESAGRIGLAKVKKRIVSRPPRDDNADAEVAEITPIALSMDVLERQAAEACRDKPGLPPEIRKALRRMEEDRARRAIGHPENGNVHSGKLWPPLKSNGGK